MTHNVAGHLYRTLTPGARCETPGCTGLSDLLDLIDCADLPGLVGMRGVAHTGQVTEFEARQIGEARAVLRQQMEVVGYAHE
jgi:hypothetical protein